MPFDFNQMPYTNFHELNLDWIISKVKEYIDKVDAAITDIEDLKNYIDQYLADNLVPAVNAKIDEMLANGTLNAIIAQALNNRVPVRGSVSNGTLQRIVEVAMSYIRKNNLLAYMHRPKAPDYDNGLDAGSGDFCGWSALEVGENVYSGDSGANGVQYIDENGNPKTGMAINCTTFADLVMLGIPFEASRYVSGIDNDTLNVGAAGYCFNPWGGNIEPSPIPDGDGNYYGVGLYDNNERMLSYFRNAGLLETLAEDASNAYPGDMIFEARDGTLTPYHCGIVLHRYDASVNSDSNEPVLLIAECVNSSMPCHLSYIHLSDLSVNGASDGWYYTAHPVYQTVEERPHEVLFEQNTAFSAMRWDISNLDLMACDYATLMLTWTPASSSEFISVQVATASDAISTVYHFPHGGTKFGTDIRYYETEPGEPQRSFNLVIPFIPRSGSQVNGSHKQITKISINVNNASANSPSITNCKLIKGTPGSGEKVILISPADLDELHSGLLNSWALGDNHYAYNHHKILVRPSSSMTIDGKTISQNYATEADVYMVSNSGAVSSLCAVFHTSAGDAVTTCTGGTWA